MIVIELSEIFRALGDPTRLRILNLLSKSELCVYQMIQVLKLKEPNVSKHLNRLRYAGLISCRKISQWCYYSIDKEFLKDNQALFEFLLSQWAGRRQFADDLKRLAVLFDAGFPPEIPFGGQEQFIANHDYIKEDN